MIVTADAGPQRLTLDFARTAGEQGVLTQDSAGDLSLADSDGSLYTFDPQGNPVAASSPADGLHAAAATYQYDRTLTPPRVTAITDPASGQLIHLYYGADTHCGVPTGYVAAGSTMLCQVAYWDGAATNLDYLPGGLLGAVVDPGPESTVLGYTSGLLTSAVSPLINDWVAAGHAFTSVDQTAIAYSYVNPAPAGTTNIRPPYSPASSPYPAGSIPMATSVTAAAPDGGPALRPRHNYTYPGTNQTQVQVVGLTATVDTDVTYDSAGRTTSQTTATGQTSTTSWDAGGQDLPTNSTDPAGRMTTTVYDWAQRVSDSYGPAPSACFQASGLPVSPLPGSCGTTVPHTHTNRDTDHLGAPMTGLQAVHWANPNEATLQTDNSTVPPTYTTNPPTYGTSAPAGALSGAAAAIGGSDQYTGTLTQSSGSAYLAAPVGDLVNDGVRVFLDNQPVIDRWWTIRQAVTADSPADYWRLNDPAGTSTPTNLAAGGGAAASSTMTYGVPGPGPVDTSTAAGVAGSGTSYLNLPSGLTGAAPTQAIELWFKTSQAGVLLGYQTSPAMGAPSTYLPALYVGASGALHGELWGGSTNMTSSASVADGHWHHVVLSATGTGQSLYLDGSPAGSSSTGVYPMPSMSYNQLGLGDAAGSPDAPGGAGSGWWGCACSFADVAFYSHPLANTQVATHYQAGTATVTSAGPVAFTSTPHTIRVDYRNPASSGNVSLATKPTPTGAATMLTASSYAPNFGLATSTATDDSGGVAGGSQTVATSYNNLGAAGGLDPVYGLATDTIVDPGTGTHLNLDSKPPTKHPAPGSCARPRPRCPPRA